MLSQGLKSTFLLWGKTQEHPHPSQICSLCPSLPDAPQPHAPPLHCVGTLPKTHSFPLISFLSRHLELPPAGSCHPSQWHRPGHTSQGSGLLFMKPKQSHVQHGAAGVTHLETTQLRIQGLLHTDDDKYLISAKIAWHIWRKTGAATTSEDSSRRLLGKYFPSWNVWWNVFEICVLTSQAVK